jgi:hypothetical protein
VGTEAVIFAVLAAGWLNVSNKEKSKANNVSGIYQNYQNGAVSNQLTDCGSVCCG